MKNKPIGRFGLFLLLALSLARCASPERASPEASPASEFLEMPASSETATIAAIYTPQLASSTSTPSPETESVTTPKPAESEEAVPLCPGRGTPFSPPADFGIPGTIIYQNSDNHGLYTIGGIPLVTSRLPVAETQKSIVFGFSPDGQWLAFAPVTRESTLQRGFANGARTISGTIVFETPAIILLSTTGEQVEHVLDVESFEFGDGMYDRWPIGWLETVLGYPDSYWINDHSIYVTLFFDDPTDAYSRGFTPRQVFDPFQGTWLNEPLKVMSRPDDGEVGFSPDMSRVLYEAQPGEHSAGIVLRDLDKGAEIWSDPRIYTFPNVIMRWAPNSSRSVLANIVLDELQLLLISREGKVNSIMRSGFSPIYALGWSPNSRYLALIVTAVNDYEVYVYDTEADSYMYTCPLIDYDEYPPDVIWSPDSSYIAFSAPVPGLPLEVLNVQTGQIFELTQDVIAVGWSDKFPVEWP